MANRADFAAQEWIGRSVSRHDALPAEQLRPGDLVSHDGVVAEIERVELRAHGSGIQTVRLFVFVLGRTLKVEVRAGTPIKLPPRTP